MTDTSSQTPRGGRKFAVRDWVQPKYLMALGATLVAISTLVVALRQESSSQRMTAEQAVQPARPQSEPAKQTSTGPDDISDYAAQRPDVPIARRSSGYMVSDLHASPVAAAPHLPAGTPDAEDAKAFHEAFARLLPREMRRAGFRPDLISDQPAVGNGPYTWTIRVPRNFPLLRVNATVTRIAAQAGGNVYWAEQDSTDLSAVHMYIGNGNTATDRVTLHQERRLNFKGTIAIVIDDVGYRSATGTMDFINLPNAVTLAILPNHDGAGARVARLARENGQDVMLHLPMEPTSDAIPLEPKTILTTMDDKTIHAIAEEHIESIPGLIGLNNHMGSRATEDERVMNAVIDVVEQHGLFFLDSRTSAQTVAQKVAQARGVLTGSRNVFLDNEKDTPHVIEKIYDVARMAERDGIAIAIGHDRDQTYEALAEVLPELERQGFRIAPVRELLR